MNIKPSTKETTLKGPASIVYSGFQEIKTSSYSECEKNFSPAYKEYRKNWEEYPQKLFIPEFPLHIDIESTSQCDLRCPMCARTVRLKKGQWRPSLELDFELFKGVIDEGSKKGLCAINLNNLGEPLSHPKLPEMIKYAKSKGILDVFFHTNGVLLDTSKGQALIESGLDRLIISFDSPYPQEYEKIRIGAKFDEVLANIKAFAELKNKLKKETPLVRINFIRFPNTKEKEIDDLVKLLSPFVDSIGLLRYVDPLKRNHTEYSKEHVSSFICPQIITRLNIWEDGRIFPCCLDYDAELCLGNIKEISLETAWKSEKLENLRKKHLAGKFFEIAACKQCTVALQGDRKGSVPGKNDEP